MDFKEQQDNVFKPRPLSLLLASVLIIFLAEALVMSVLPFLGVSNQITLNFIDASLLALIITPALYFLFFRPMRNTIIELEKSETIQKRLRELDELKSEFISIAAHELCSPVSTITSFTELLLAGVNPEQQKKYLQYILGRTEALERIISDLQVVKVLEVGEDLLIQKDSCDLVETIDNIIKAYQEKFPDKPFHLKIPSQPVVFQFDKVRISQVLDNVISNAIKYSNDIHDPIDVTLSDHRDHVEIIVRDEGIGMSAEELKMIYTKFFRAQTEKSTVGGLGLGMAIVKSIVESHDGNIDIISQRKVGTTVSITLPK